MQLVLTMKYQKERLAYNIGGIRMIDIIKQLEDRGYIEQLTHEKEMRELFQKESVRFYIGIDPTADSLHIGHCVPYCILRRFQKAGHKVVLLMGGATAQIGDPTGRSEIRKILDQDTIKSNVEKIKGTLKKFLDLKSSKLTSNVRFDMLF